MSVVSGRKCPSDFWRIFNGKIPCVAIPKLCLSPFGRARAAVMPAALVDVQADRESVGLQHAEASLAEDRGADLPISRETLSSISAMLVHSAAGLRGFAQPSSGL